MITLHDEDLMESDEQVPKGFRKKVYTKLSTSKLSSHLSHSISQMGQGAGKKIVATRLNTTLREEFKKMFLPLLIDIFELRQATANWRHHIFNESVIELSIKETPPSQILQKLEDIQKQIQEAQNWCDGVILQISKGLDEAKTLLDEINQKNRQEKRHKKSKNFLKSLLRLFQRS